MFHDPKRRPGRDAAPSPDRRDPQAVFRDFAAALAHCEAALDQAARVRAPRRPARRRAAGALRASPA
jgi:hypothetical protein